MSRPLTDTGADVEKESAWGSAGDMVALRSASECEREERILMVAARADRRWRPRIRFLRPQRDLEGGTR
jgi:hypothetical protein